jgi:hypothetical protein
MATKELKNIFLSASVPLPERDKKYFDTADIIAIRDAVIGLATAVLPHCRIVWGGHPSITPLMYYVMEKLHLNIQDHLIIYQSKFFAKYYPEDNNKFKNIVQTPSLEDRPSSLSLMRNQMLKSCDFSAGVFIGGMDGVEDEFVLFRELHPNALVIPVASTGAAAKMIFEKLEIKDQRFINDFAYMSLFQDYLLQNL